MSLSVKRACDLHVGDRLSLPAAMLPPDAIVESKRVIGTFGGKQIVVCQLKTLGDNPWAVEAALWPNEKINYYKPPGRLKRSLGTLNAWVNPLAWFQQ